MKKGFTIIEVLLVIAIVAALITLLLPVFDTARARARQTVCASNMRQLGTAFSIYTQDYDEQLPYGGDSLDLNTPLWSTSKLYPQVQTMSPLPIVMASYVTTPKLWMCPSDTGFTYDGWSQQSLNAVPSEFEAYGMSYAYHTRIPLMHISLPSIIGYDTTAPYAEHGPSEVYLLRDTSDTWHALGPDIWDARQNLLLCDGHVVNVDTDTARPLIKRWVGHPPKH